MKQRRILVVDDTPRNVKLLADILSASGYAIETASSGAEALAAIARSKPDLVLLDVVMPGMSGYEVCQTIRQDPLSHMLPVVMVTALEASAERVRGLEAGADDFLSKPIHQPELLARVRSLLRIKQLYDTVEEQASQLASWNRTLEERVARQVTQLERLGKLKRFLPPQVVEQIVEGGSDDPLQSHRREIAVVFLDLRGFTAFAETNAPEEVMAVLAEYHHAIGAQVAELEGTIERFGSDGVMIFFNDPIPQLDATERAVRLALALRERCRDLAAAWEKRGFDLNPGFGVTQGYATLGAIGLETRSDYAAIGTVTSMAIRLCELARPGEILVSQRVQAAVDEQVESEPAGELDLRGFLRPVPAFRVLGARGVAGAAGAPRATEDAAGQTFRREGEYWTIAYHGASARVRDSKGLRYIAHLLRHPEQEIHALDLVALGRRADEEGEAAPTAADGGRAADRGDAGPVLDAAARSAYRERLEELRAELAEAESMNDVGTAERYRAEIDLLSRQLSSAVGLGGRERRVGAAAERARVNVTRAISDAVKRIHEHCAPLARHLDASVRTGTFCVYRPPRPADGPWEL